MPQLSQLSDVALSQLFWLLIGLAAIYFGVAKAMLPKIQATVDQRDARIAGDLAAAEAAKAEAEATEEAYRAAMDKSRAEAMKLTVAAKQEGALATEKKVAKADASLQAKLAKAEEKMRKATEAARAEIDSVAAELAADITKKVAGIPVSKDDAAKALKATANG
jgi:F-type H+-transporting ATPase subunit b